MTKLFACAAAAVLIAGPAVADDCGWNKSAQAPAPGFAAAAVYEAPAAVGAAQTVAASASEILVYDAPAPTQDQSMSYAPAYSDAVFFTLSDAARLNDRRLTSAVNIGDNQPLTS